MKRLPLLNSTYYSTPFPWCNHSPTELLMGRCSHANVPITSDQLTPEWTFLPQFRDNNCTFKDRQKRDYNLHHRARALPHSYPWKFRRSHQVTSPSLVEWSPQHALLDPMWLILLQGQWEETDSILTSYLMVTNQAAKPNSPFETQSELDHVLGYRFALLTDCDLCPGKGDMEWTLFPWTIYVAHCHPYSHIYLYH